MKPEQIPMWACVQLDLLNAVHTWGTSEATDEREGKGKTREEGIEKARRKDMKNTKIWEGKLRKRWLKKTDNTLSKKEGISLSRLN